MNTIAPVNYVNSNYVNAVSSIVHEVVVTEKHFLDDDGYNDEMVYYLDDGIALCFRWYCDPGFSVGERFTYTECNYGIQVTTDRGSFFMQGPPGGRWFESR
jgi:hypothetical protein